MNNGLVEDRGGSAPGDYAQWTPVRESNSPYFGSAVVNQRIERLWQDYDRRRVLVQLHMHAWQSLAVATGVPANGDSESQYQGYVLAVSLSS